MKNKQGNGNLLTQIQSEYQLHLVMLLPMIWFIIFRYIPMYGAQIAFRDFSALTGIWRSPWIGLEHFEKFFASYQFARVLRNTLGISIYYLIASFPIPILLALAINNSENLRFKKFVQMVIYAPHFISMVVMVGMLIQFLSPTIGIVNVAIRALGGESVNFLGSASLFKSVYVWSGVWQSAGWGTVIYLAALASVDPQIHEAALIDGASKFQRTWLIDFPSILPTVTIILILNFGQLMNVGFEKVYLMQNSLNLRSSEIIQTYVYKVGLRDFPRYSYASAIGLFNSVINFVLVLTVNQAAKRINGNSLW